MQENNLICYVCKKEITKKQIIKGQKVSIGQDKYRHKKCRIELIKRAVKLYKQKRATWTINPVSRIKPNTKRKSRAKIKQEIIKELKNV